MPTEEMLKSGAASGLELLDTPEFEVPPEEADAHIATIKGITYERIGDNQTPKVSVVTQTQSGFEAKYDIFPPAVFVDNVAGFMTGQMTAEDISDDVPEGKKQSPRQRYGAVISNSKKDAEFQRLRAIAAEAGRTLAPGTEVPTTFDGYVEMHNSLLTGLEVVILRRPQKNEANPQFDGRLQVSRILPLSTVSNPKGLKGYKKRWEE